MFPRLLCDPQGRTGDAGRHRSGILPVRNHRRERALGTGTSELERPTPGVLPGFITRIGAADRIQAPSIVVRRSVYEKLGGFRTDLPQVADWEMWVRVAAHYPIWYEPATLAAWRIHSASWTADFVRSAENIVDERRCIAVIRPLLPSDRAESISRKARENVARRALSNAYHALGRAEFGTALRQACEGLKCSASPRVVMRAILLLPVRVARDVMRGAFAAGKRQLARGRG